MAVGPSLGQSSLAPVFTQLTLPSFWSYLRNFGYGMVSQHPALPCRSGKYSDRALTSRLCCITVYLDGAPCQLSVRLSFLRSESHPISLAIWDPRKSPSLFILNIPTGHVSVRSSGYPLNNPKCNFCHLLLRLQDHVWQKLDVLEVFINKWI